MDTREFLGTIPFFTEVLDATQVDQLAAGARRVRYQKGDSLIREDDLGESMFALIGGEVEVSVHDRGKERHVATVSAGQIVGEMSLLTGARRSASVVAVTEVTAIEIPKSALQPILNSSPILYEHFAAMLEKRQKELDRIYGGGFWNLFGLPADELTLVMRSFFGG
ncbi:MAG: cyclic nucleotide-binding domain-containing protein [Bauldia sp.]